MNKNNLTNFKFLSEIYVSFKQKKLNSLNERANKLRAQIENEKAIIQEKTQYFQQLKERNNSVKNSYNDLINLFADEYKAFTIPNNSYNIKVFENVFIQRKLTSYIIVTKTGEEIYTFDTKFNDFLEYLLTLNYSIIVLSAEPRSLSLKINIQL